MLKITGLTLKTEETLLCSTDCVLKDGKIYGLSAINGAGKTTFLRTVAGIRYEKEGKSEILIEGNVLNVGNEKKHVFYFETSEWFDTNLSGKDYLAFISSMWHKKPIKADIDSVISYWDLSDFIHKPIRKYSLGMKQKVLLALYAVSNADCWLMDEPTIGLDAKSCEKFQDYLRLARARGKTILFSSHQNDSLYNLCDDIYEITNKSLVLVENSREKAR